MLHLETKIASSDATLPLPDVCAAALRLRKVEETHARDVARSAWQGGKLIFTTKWRTPIEPRNVNRAWDARCAKAGVRKITVHSTHLTRTDAPRRECLLGWGTQKSWRSQPGRPGRDTAEEACYARCSRSVCARHPVLG